MNGWMEFAAHRLPLRRGTSPAERIARSEQMLLHALGSRATVAFLGSGCSIPFGYPSWERFAREVVKCTHQALSRLHKRDETVRPDLKRVEAFVQRLTSGREPALRQDALMFFIGACQEVLERRCRQGEYHEYLHRRFSKDRAQPKLDAYELLLGLPIRRFITTNYDCVIESALHRLRGIPLEDFGLPQQGAPVSNRRLSFTQKRENYDQLALFALARVKENENMVFHCHGRYDDPDSVIASEADYQRWYFTEQDGAGFAFRQSIELLLGSNPLLFIGYGLRDEDLLRPLRHLGALDPARKDSRPIFALLEIAPEDKETEQYFHESVFERYGLHVIPYECARSTNARARSEALCRKLREIRERLEEAKRRWIEKPKVKEPLSVVELPQPHFKIQSVVQVPIGTLEELAAEVSSPGIVGVVGPSGCGKTLHLSRLIDEVAAPGCGSFEGCFYWNFHYSNEFMTALDQALNYLDPRESTQGSRHERILQCLRGHRFLVILDGCERLLRKHNGNGDAIGKSDSPAFSRLLQILADPGSRSTVVLSTRLWPIELDALQDRQGMIRRVAIKRVELGDLEVSPALRRPQSAVSSFRPLLGSPEGRSAISALCSLLHGHNYGLQMAGHYLSRSDEPLRSLKDLVFRLSQRTPDQRVRKMISILLESLDGGRKNGLAFDFVERLALFLSPVSEPTLRVCFDEACEARSEHELCDRQSLVQRLIECDLLFPMLRAGSEVKSAYSVHAMVRSHLFQPRHGPVADALPGFRVSGFTSGQCGVDPDLAKREQIQKLFENLYQSAQAAVASSDLQAARDLCRDAFGLLRNRMESNTAPRWCSYEEYLQFGLRLVMLLKQISLSLGMWDYCAHYGASELTQHKDAPLYLTELAWLYNDIGLALSSEGYLSDAYAVWEQSYEISRLIEDPGAGGEYQLETLLSLVHIFLEMGRLQLARRYLAEAERLNHSLGDEDCAARILGFKGLIVHIGGDLQEADRLYGDCIEKLKKGNNLRAQSFFLKHQADVKIGAHEYDKAELLIRTSRAIAEVGVYPDLVAYARVSEGHRLANKGEAAKARLEYHAVLREAQRIGIRKLEAEIQSTLSRLAFDQGDAEGARLLAMKSLSLANELGLGLRLTHSLVVLGLATIKAGQRDLGVAYLRHAKKLADEQEYWYRGREAENKLQELGESVGPPDLFRPFSGQ